MLVDIGPTQNMTYFTIELLGKQGHGSCFGLSYVLKVLTVSRISSYDIILCTTPL